MKHSLTMSEVDIPRPNVATVTTSLDLWNSSDPTTSLASENRQLSQETKTFVEGKTQGQLLAELKVKIKEEAQSEINDFQQADIWRNAAALINTISDIDGTLIS